MRADADEASSIRREPGAHEVVVEPEELPESQLLHHGEARAVDPTDATVAVADEEVPGVPPSLERGLDDMAEATALDRFSESDRVIGGAARLEQGHRLREHPFTGHEATP